MATLTGKSWWPLVPQALPWCYFVGMLSLPVSVWAVFEVGISRARCCSRLWSVRFRKNVFYSLFCLKLWNRIWNLICNKVWLWEHFICLITICDVLYIITSVMTPCNDPDLDWPSLLKGEMSHHLSFFGSVIEAAEFEDEFFYGGTNVTQKKRLIKLDLSLIRK
jgi:hypothetical protein